MPIQAARAFNRTCPKGSLVEAAMRDGSTRTGKTKGPAIVWAGYALVEVEGWPGYWTVQAVRPALVAIQPQALGLEKTVSKSA